MGGGDRRSPPSAGTVMAEAVRRCARRPARPGRSSRSPRISSTSSCPSDLADSVAARRCRDRTSTRSRAVLQLLASARRPVILAGGGVLRARTSNDLAPARRAAPRAGHRVVAPRRRDLERPSALPRDGGHWRAGRVRERLELADAMLVDRLPARARSRPVRLHDPGGSDTAGPTSISRRGGPRRTLPCARRPAIRRTPGCSSGRPFSGSQSRGVLDAARRRRPTGRERRGPRRLGGGHHRRRPPVGRPGRPPGRIVTTLRQLLPDDAILTTDAGSFGGWAARGFRFRRPGTFLGPPPARWATACPPRSRRPRPSRPSRRRAVGDGGLGMTLSEIETAVRMGLRTIVLVFDNQRYGMIRMYQERRGAGIGVATDLGPLDFAAAAARSARAASGSRTTRRSSRLCGRRSRPTGRRSSTCPSTGAGCRSTPDRPEDRPAERLRWGSLVA